MCHDQTQQIGGFGRKLRGRLVVEYRDDWLERVIERRDLADKMAIRFIERTNQDRDFEHDDEQLVKYVNSLPGILRSLYQLAEPKMNGTTLEIIDGVNFIIDSTVYVLVHLASFYPKNHFDGMPAEEYFSRYVASRASWHRALIEPDPNESGTIVGIVMAYGVLEDTQNLVEQMVAREEAPKFQASS